MAGNDPNPPWRICPPRHSGDNGPSPATDQLQPRSSPARRSISCSSGPSNPVFRLPNPLGLISMSGQPSFSADSGPGATSDLTAETAREAIGQRARNWTSSQCGRPRNGVRYPPTGWPKWPCCACWRRKPGRTPGPNRACQHENAQCQHRMGFGHEANPKAFATTRGCAACIRQDARRSRTRWQLRDKSRVWVDMEPLFGACAKPSRRVQYQSSMSGAPLVEHRTITPESAGSSVGHPDTTVLRATDASPPSRGRCGVSVSHWTGMGTAEQEPAMSVPVAWVPGAGTAWRHGPPSIAG